MVSFGLGEFLKLVGFDGNGGDLMLAPFGETGGDRILADFGGTGGGPVFGDFRAGPGIRGDLLLVNLVGVCGAGGSLMLLDPGASCGICEDLLPADFGAGFEIGEDLSFVNPDEVCGAGDGLVFVDPGTSLICEGLVPADLGTGFAASWGLKFEDFSPTSSSVSDSQYGWLYEAHALEVSCLAGEGSRDRRSLTLLCTSISPDR